jgi:hypothetical protein
MPRQEIDPEVAKKLIGRVFVWTSSYSASSIQVTGYTRFYIRARSVPMNIEYDRSTGNSRLTVKWDWIDANRPSKGEETQLYSLYHADDDYYLKNKSVGCFWPESERGQVYEAVEY